MIDVNELKVKREIRENINSDEFIHMLEKEVDRKLLTTNLIYKDKVEVIIKGEYSKEIRDVLASKYEREGNYSKVQHHTSSENGERAGLTNFTFYL